MLSVLDNPEIRKHALPVSVAGYHLLFEKGFVPKRAELIRGVIFGKERTSPLHAAVTSILHRELFRSLGAEPWYVRQGAPLTLADSEPEPDIAVVAGSPEDYSHAHPTTAHLVIEVAVTSEDLDREKASIYAEAGVGECWLILANERIVEVHSGAKHGHWSNVRRVPLRQNLTRDDSLPPGVTITSLPYVAEAIEAAREFVARFKG